MNKKPQPERVKIGVDRPYRLSDGITQSILGDYISCKVRARHKLNAWRSLRPRTALNFGSLFHGLLQEAYDTIRDGQGVPEFDDLVDYVIAREAPDLILANDYEALLIKARVLYDEYFIFWQADLTRDWTWTEKLFDVNFNGFRLRGKRDGAYRIGKKRPRPWLLETKTASGVNEDAMDQGLPLDLQLLLYLTATEIETGEDLAGALYNVVVKPGQNFTGSFNRKPETLDEYAVRVEAAVQADPSKYFRRYEVKFTASDKKQFKSDLEIMLAEFGGWWEGHIPEYRGYGSCYSKWACEYLPACSSGTLAGYHKRALFGELLP